MTDPFADEPAASESKAGAKGIDDALAANVATTRTSGAEAEARLEAILENAGIEPEPELPPGASLDHFYAYMPEHKYLCVPTGGDLWPSASVNARVPPVIEEGDDGKRKPVAAAAWLDRNRPVDQMTWIPGQPTVIRDRLVGDGSWIEQPGWATYNRYRPARCAEGDPKDVKLWWEHLLTLYGEASAMHILAWCACRVQQPGGKINHALVLGGAQGIGKDTLLAPLRYAVGPWNFAEVSPIQLLDRFNPFVRSVILRISEARDLGDVDRYAFYEHTKTYIASPPDVLMCNEKHVKAYPVFNVTGVIITTNHRTDGLYLPADDRRHYVAWSEATKEHFTPEYWKTLWGWYDNGGMANVAAYLRTIGLGPFDPKAPPPRTEAFRNIIDAHRPGEEAELWDALEALAWPEVVSKDELLRHDLIPIALKEWLNDRKNSRQFGRRLESIGYLALRNDRQTDGRWKINGKNTALYSKQDVPPEKARERADELCGVRLNGKVETE